MTSPSHYAESAASERRYRVIAAGFQGHEHIVRPALDDPDPLVRASALRALARLGTLAESDLCARITDPEPFVRITVAELAASHPGVPVHSLVDDDDLFVAEMAAWCLGERESPTDTDIDVLIERCTSHPQALVREACAASLGSIGDPRGLPAILAACRDKPAVRRRAILALAPFEGDEVEEALHRALEDRDWQVRQNAEDLLQPRM